MINLMDNSHCQDESVYLAQQSVTTEIQNNSTSPVFENLIDSHHASVAGNLYFGDQQNEQLLNMVEPERGMNSPQETIPDTGNTTYLLTAKINRMKLKTDLVRFFMENKVG